MAKASNVVLGTVLGLGMCGYAVSKMEEGGNLSGSSPPARSSGAANGTAAASLGPKPELVQGWELVKAYDKNEVAADNAYKGKRLRVVGKIRDIGKDVLDDPYVTIGESFKGVNCYFDKDAGGVVATLSKGDPIVLEGDCRGLSIGSVILRKCSLPSGDTLRADHPAAFQAAAATPKKKRRAAAEDE